MGLRYRVNWPVPERPRRTIDIAFPRWKLAVFIDGCFWHRCKTHYTPPRANAEFWERKTLANVSRDSETTSLLERQGWTVLRFFEHESADAVAEEVSRTLGDLGRC